MTWYKNSWTDIDFSSCDSSFSGTITIIETTLFCPNCGRMMDLEWDYCPYCGVYLRAITATASE